MYIEVNNIILVITDYVIDNIIYSYVYYVIGNNMTMGEVNYVRTSVSITYEQKKWLDEHPEINLSGLVQMALNEEIKLRYRKEVLL